MIALTPNATMPRGLLWGIVAAWVALWLALWAVARPALLPSPVAVLQAFPALWFDDGLGRELLSSWSVTLQALVISTAFGLPLAYLSRVPAVQPLAAGASALRFLSPAVFFLLLLFVMPDGHWVKVGMLVAGQVFFLLTSMMGAVLAVPDAALDDARTLRMNEWQVTWYAVVRATLPDAISAVRDNAAMAFAMVMMVEGFIRSEGGVGVMLLEQSKFMNIANVYAIAGAVLAVGLAQDFGLTWLRRALCPYAEGVK